MPGPADCLVHPLTCLGGGITTGAGDAATSAWDAVCRSFADAAAGLLKAFGQAFAAMPDISLDTAGISSAYVTCVAVAASVAVLLVFGQVIRTAWTRDGSGIAEAVTGVARAVLAWLLTVSVATAALEASDGITGFIVVRSFGSQQALADRLATIVDWAQVTGDPGQAVLGGSGLLVLALAGIVLVIVLWFELLLRNAAIAVLIAMSPVAAAGMVSEATRAWWTRTAAAVVQLIVLKPVIALVFAVGFGMAGSARGVEQVLAGLLILALAAFSWPVIARFFTFASIQASSSGLVTALGFALGMAAQSSGSGGPAGVSPDQWSMAAENRTMAGRGGAVEAGNGLPSSGGAGAGTAALPGAATGGVSGAGTGGAGGPGGGSGAAALAGIGFALQKAHQAGSALAGRMEQTAAHAGMHGAYPYSTVSAGGRPGSGRVSQPGAGTGQSAPAPEPGGAQAADAVPDVSGYSPARLDAAGYDPAAAPASGIRDQSGADAGQGPHAEASGEEQ